MADSSNIAPHTPAPRDHCYYCVSKGFHLCNKNDLPPGTKCNFCAHLPNQPCTTTVKTIDSLRQEPGQRNRPPAPPFPGPLPPNGVFPAWTGVSSQPLALNATGSASSPAPSPFLQHPQPQQQDLMPSMYTPLGNPNPDIFGVFGAPGFSGASGGQLPGYTTQPRGANDMGRGGVVKKKPTRRSKNKGNSELKRAVNRLADQVEEQNRRAEQQATEQQLQRQQEAMLRQQQDSEQERRSNDLMRANRHDAVDYRRYGRGHDSGEERHERSPAPYDTKNTEYRERTPYGYGRELMPDRAPYSAHTATSSHIRQPSHFRQTPMPPPLPGRYGRRPTFDQPAQPPSGNNRQASRQGQQQPSPPRPSNVRQEARRKQQEEDTS